jgi:uncharacterized protein (DUF433 family)
MSKVVSVRLRDEQVQRLGRAARRLGRTPSEALVTLLEEALRLREFAFVEFRDSPVGRQAYLQGTRLAVWHVAKLARAMSADASAVSAELSIPTAQVRAALTYAEAFPDELEAAIADSKATETALRGLVPNLEAIELEAIDVEG